MLIDLPNFYDETALYLAAEHGNLSIVELLANNGARLTYASKNPLHIACSRGYFHVVEFLYRKDTKLADRNLSTDCKCGHVRWFRKW